MRSWIFSDLLIESCRLDLPDPRPDYDVLVAAGDIHSPATVAIDWLAESANGKTVIFVRIAMYFGHPGGLIGSVSG